MLRAVHVLAIAAAVLTLAPLAASYPWQACNGSSNYTANSAFQRNLGVLAAALPGNASTSPDLLANATVGGAPDTVYALAFCPPIDNQNASGCRACVASAFADARSLFPEQQGRKHHLRRLRPHLLRPGLPRRPQQTRRTWRGSSETPRTSTSPTSASSTGPSTSMAWCTPDMAPGRCRACLADTIAQMHAYFNPNAQGARLVGVRCAARYEDLPVQNRPRHGAGAGKKSKTGKILAIVLPIVAALLASAMICFCCWRRRTKATKLSLSYSSRSEDIQNIESLIMDLPTLRIATDNFAENNKLGEGGFGEVYKGSFPGGQTIAVKRLSQSSGQGIGELKNELVLIAKLQHKNLVRLVGVCLEQEEKLLVYEYMPNKSLDTFLFDPEKRKQIDWAKRFMIIKGITGGLQYLHEDSQLKIIHRDLKASNVLLDANMNPKISDFGLARLFGDDQSQETTNRVVGTYGYMAPEYALRGQYSIKSDVYSFGVLLLEIITGRKNSDSYNSEQAVDLLSLVWEHWAMKTITEMVDPYLRSDSSSLDEILRCIHVGLVCVQEDPMDRPTLSMINIMLDGNTVSAKAPSRPAFFTEMLGNINIGSSMYSQPYPVTDSTAKHSTAMSLNDVTVTEPEPR
ncbi:hypothetical protein OsJ_25223 [Oryza sativa Japonica Group]|uniref:Uncharacterized protein n=1 Tax=Oryza sativa subsp. japonica TaxID=39947 RepID=A3BMG2_ORYSJ|nr:hypothetical protein OsJ_25223 [Oryza sativa Japonica Group]